MLPRVDSIVEAVRCSDVGSARVVPPSVGEFLIEEYGLRMERRPGCVANELSAAFEVDGVVLRLRRTWLRQYQLLNGEWRPKRGPSTD